MQEKKDFVTIRSPWQDPFRKALFHVAMVIVKLITGFNIIEKRWQHMLRDNPEGFENDPKTYLDAFFKENKLDWKIYKDSIGSIPKEGPVIITANHSYGMIDGLILMRILLDIRSDIKVIANEFLDHIVPLKGLFFIVNPMEKKTQTRNLKGLRESIRWVKKGGALAVFPSGEVARWKLKKRRISETDWSPTVGGLIRMCDAQVIPCYFAGHLQWWFHVTGLISLKLGTFLLPRANIRQENKTIDICFGTPIPSSKLSQFASDVEMVRWLRFRTYLLKSNLVPFEPEDVQVLAEQGLDIVKAQDKDIMAAEVEALVPRRIVAESGSLITFYCMRREAPTLIKEVGRLREQVFRSVGEGTGKSIDIDHYDSYYHHLILWDKEEREICGAYRFGLSDKIVEEHGRDGLYTASLFRLKRGFLRKVNPAVELGRSFIIPKWQRKPQSLLTLWRGLAQWCFLHPRYNHLFGVVSISSDYNPLSRELIALFLKKHAWYEELSPTVKAKNPPSTKEIHKIDGKVKENLLADLDDISVFVAQIESGRDIPVLLRQYLKLKGRLLGFNIDSDFGNCMDGLIITDLKEIETKLLGRFMGLNKAKAYGCWHDLSDAEKETITTEQILQSMNDEYGDV